MTERTGAVVIGAGVVGLACARALALQGIETVIIEANVGMGMETSSRNSEVIHTGIYYATGSLRARLCVEGMRSLYEFCETRHVDHRRCGKLIVATTQTQVAGLEKLLSRGERNGVHGLKLLSATEARALEPRLKAAAVLHSPATGIVDSHGLMVALLAEAQAHGAVLALKSPLLRVEPQSGGFRLDIGGIEPIRLHTPIVINAAGLHATRIAAAIEGLAPSHVPRVQLAKGQYFAYSGSAPFSHLIYPLGEAGEFVVPYTFDLGGQVRLGPSVEAVDEIDYALNERGVRGFYDGARHYWPELPEGTLQPAFCGNWPRLSGVNERPVDFVIQSSTVHGLPGLINLFGIDSPGVTSCLAIARHVCSELAVEGAVRSPA